jgi:hydrogenase/urease accessory protein HupE
MKKILALILLPNAALAHAGDHSHSAVMENLIHLVTEPDHLMMMGAAALLAGLVFYRKQAVKKAGKK